MAEKHIVVQGAVCKCQFGQVPDTIKVLSHRKEYANDKDASKKLIGVHFKKTWACWQANLGYFAIRRLYKWCLLPYEMSYF
jgi:hypothetical protein